MELAESFGYWTCSGFHTIESDGKQIGTSEVIVVEVKPNQATELTERLWNWTCE